MKTYVLLVLLCPTLYYVSGNALQPDPASEWCGGNAGDNIDPCCRLIKCPYRPLLQEKGLFTSHVTQSYPCDCFKMLKKCRKEEGVFRKSFFSDVNYVSYWPFSSFKDTECYVAHRRNCYFFGMICSPNRDSNPLGYMVKTVEP